MAKADKDSNITINGFKDKEMIMLSFIASQSGHNITLTIEGLNELKTIIEVAKQSSLKVPNIGIRVRLHSTGSGIWAKSGGIDAKFGLTSTEIIEAIKLLNNQNLIDKLSMIHFHIGSQMGDIAPLKKALREAGNIYAELRRRGSNNLNAINIGGGLAVEYAQHPHAQERNYSLEEFANDVIYLMSEISKRKNVAQPDIFTESGRYIASSHSVLIAPVLELFSQEYSEKNLKLKESSPPLIQELYDLYNTLKKTNAREYLHDALDHMESLLTLFDLGYIDLEDRSNTELLVNLIIKKAINLLKDDETNELQKLQDRIQEKYLVNFSAFQSLPDFWGLGQHFPVMPIDKLDTKPTNPATIWDITCDSDGEIGFDRDTPLYLHDIDIETQEYFLAFFLTGAYQEVLGMKHNLFTHPTEIVVNFNENGDYSLDNLIEAQNIMDVLEDMDYNRNIIGKKLKYMIEGSNLLNYKQKENILGKLYLYLSENSYLKTIQANREDYND